MMLRWLGLAFVASCWFLGRADAQDASPSRPTAVVIMGESPGEPHVAIAHAAERVVRARLDSLGVTAPVAPPALPLAELALALGCEPETPMCLGAIASELGATLLVVPSLSAGDDTLVLELRLFDSRTGNLPARVVRSAQGTTREAALFDQIEDGLREILELERLAPPTPPPSAAPPVPPTTAATSVADGDSVFPTLAWSAAGGAALSFSVAALFGAMSASSESDYANAPTSTPADVDRAIGFRASAERDARIANVALATGGAFAIASALLFLLASDEEEAPVSARLDVRGRASIAATVELEGRF